MGYVTVVSAQNVTLTFRQTSLEEIFTEITRQTGFTFAYSRPVIDPTAKVSVDVKNVELKQALDKLFAGTNIAYEISGKKVLLFSRQQTVDKRAAGKNNIVVTGVVTDALGALAGASVKVKGTNKAVVTDVDGRFSLDADAQGVLEVSFIGYSTKEVPIVGRTQVEVTMEEAAQALEEVVIVGYGTQVKKTMTGSVSVIKSDDMETSSKSTIAQALQWKAAGLRVNQISAQAGGGSKFRIRGEASTGAGNEPLIVIDGFPVAATSTLTSGNLYNGASGTTDNILESLNPDDIESISVLKDAASTAIYGARAGHGVILITTKRGAKKGNTVTYSGNVSIQTVAKQYEMLTPLQYMDMRNRQTYEEHLRTYGLSIYEGYTVPPGGDVPPYIPAYTTEEMKYNKGTDWVKEVSRTGSLHQHNLSVSGSSETGKYLVSGNYMNQEGIIKGNAASRFSVRANLDKDLSKYFSIGLTATYSQNKYDNVPLGDGEYEYAGVIRSAAMFNPTLSIRDVNGDYALDPVRSTSPNPVSLLDIEDVTTKDRILGNVYLIVKPFKDLEIKLQVGADRRFQDRSSYLPKTMLEGMRKDGEANIRKENSIDFLIDYTATYSKSFGDHKLKAMAGYAAQRFTGRRENLGNSHFKLDGFSYYNIGAGEYEKPWVGSGAWKSTILSYFGRINYDFLGRYLFEASIRADGASNFKPGRQWGYFPSVAAGWIISEEPFMKAANSWLSNLKVRASYGETGNYNVGNHVNDYFEVLTTGYQSVIGDKIVSGVATSDLGNEKLTWETTSELNIGLDVAFLKNRFSLTAEYFQREIRDLLSRQSLMSYFEVTEVYANAGITASKGFEITVNTVNVDRKDFSWHTTATLAHYEDRWKERSAYWKPASYQQADDYIRAWWSYESLGLWRPAVGESQPMHQPNLVPGGILIKDQNGDNKLSEEDMIYMGTSDPDLIFGFQNTFRYKQFDLNLYFYGEIGQTRGASYMEQWIDMYYGQNVTQYAYEAFNHNNLNATRPSFLRGSGNGYGSFYVKDVFYIRCGDIKLGYTIPIKKTIINKLYAYVDFSNLFVITNWTGLDPETDNNSFSYPNVRAYTLGINITF
jgi:TonB-linked SusC/RagA family outer membrane protein